MDPASIAVSVITILSPFLKKSAEELVKTVGEVAYDKAKGLLELLRQRFAGDPVAKKDLERFEKDPEKFGPALEASIQEQADADGGFANELAQRLQEIGPTVNVFQTIKDGTDVIGAEADVQKGTVNVTQDAERVERMVGFRGTVGKS